MREDIFETLRRLHDLASGFGAGLSEEVCDYIESHDIYGRPVDLPEEPARPRAEAPRLKVVSGGLAG